MRVYFIVFTTTFMFLLGCSRPGENNDSKLRQNSKLTQNIEPVVAQENAEPIQSDYYKKNTSAAAVFEQIDDIIRVRYVGKERKKWLYFTDKFRRDSIVGIDETSFVALALENNNEILNLLLSIPNLREDFPNFSYLVALANNERATLNYERAKSDNEFVCSLPGSECED